MELEGFSLFALTKSGEDKEVDGDVDLAKGSNNLKMEGIPSFYSHHTNP